MKRCLFVDDSAVIRKVAKRVLSPEVAVAEAASGGEALATCHMEMPDVLVIDMALPDMPGVELISRLRAMPAVERPSILVMLIEMDLGAIMRAKRAGADGFVLKPFNRAQLFERLKDIDQQRARTANAA